MRLNPSNGKAALGVFTVISIDGVEPAAIAGVPASLPTWIDPAGNVIFFFNNTAGELQTLDLDSGSPVTASAGGATRLASGNNVWVASLSAGALQGVRSNISGWNRMPLAGLGDMDEDGSFAIIQAFAQDRGIVCFDNAGTQTASFDVPLTAAATVRCKTDIVAFSGSGWNWQLRRLSTGAQVPFARRETGVIETVPLTLSTGRTIVVERTGNDTLTVREATSNQGYILSSTIVYNPDVIEWPVGSGNIRVGWSASAGEPPTGLRMVDLSFGSGSTTDWTSASGSLVSSTGPTLVAETMPTGAVEGSGLAKYFINRAPFTEPKTGILTEQFGWPFLRNLVKTLGQPIDLTTQVTGVLGPDNGGTGGTGGTSVINASDVTIGLLPANVKYSEFGVTSTGTVNDLYFASATAIRCANASPLTLTGLLAGTGGQIVVIEATDADVTLANLTGSGAGNQFETFTGADVTIAAGEAGQVVYDATDGVWRVLFVSAVASAADPSFGVISVTGQTDVDATIPTAEVEFVAGSNITITTDAGATPKQVIFSSSASSVDYVVLGNGVQPPTPVDDGMGSFIYVGYTP